MTRELFGRFLTGFCKRTKRIIKSALQSSISPTPTSLASKPRKKNLRKSKKLEIAVGKIVGLDLNLVNLRKEVYEEDSRTPEMEFGTAEEDTFRRDATVNALFFNLDTQHVVGLVRKGLDDMALCVIRTPLYPQQIIVDDPLRLLRLVRTGSKLGYTINGETKDVCKTLEFTRHWKRKSVGNGLESRFSTP
jgi:tRNA nucleotidyltransferase/poly(A) polymerase